MNPSDFSLTTLTDILECYACTYKKLQSLDIGSQRITQLTKTILTTLENLNTLFNSSKSLYISTGKTLFL